jgi:hypothetical protein
MVNQIPSDHIDCSLGEVVIDDEGDEGDDELVEPRFRYKRILSNLMQVICFRTSYFQNAFYS